MSKFFTNEQVSLEKGIDGMEKIHQTSVDNIKFVYEIERCVEWIRTNHFKQVCLQFPDHMLPDSVEVSLQLQDALDQPVYIMGDTAYESCCLDFIAAAHVNADAIIHFGSICFSQSAKSLPYLNIYEKCEINVEELKRIVDTFMGKDEIVGFLLIDTPYLYKIDSIKNLLALRKHIKILQLDQEIDYTHEGLYIYVGNNTRKLKNIQFFLNEKYLYSFDPSSPNPEIFNFTLNPVVLKRRNYLAEKIKDSQTFGIVMGTLAVDNYLRILGRIKKILKLNRKKYYVISVGKISVSKLANFPEMDVYIVISCAMNEVYDSKDFYKPIATPYDVEKAFNPEKESISFSYDYNSFLDKVTPENDLKPLNEPDVSLLTGNLRFNGVENDSREVVEGGEMILKMSGTLVESSKFGAGYLAERSWKGLKENLGQTEVKLVKEGRTGIAQKYSNEPKENT